MRVSAAQTAQRVEQNQYSLTKKIKSYGQNNDYPQKILEIVNSSGTGKVCFDVYVKFIEGGGFADEALAETVLNARGERANGLLRKCAKDLRMFNGFAILVKYDYNAKPFAYYNVPFEHCRIEIDGKKEYTGRIALHPDWTGIKGHPFKLTDIKYINHYDPVAVPQQIEDAGGPENYLGQMLYFTADGDFEYPVCPFDPIVTDMLTEESVSTVKHRNAKYNFLPSGILVRKGIKPATTDTGVIDDTDPHNQEQAASAAEIKSWQGDANACKMLVVDVDADEEKPEFIPFDAKNFDRQFELTEQTVQENIGRMSLIPPILRGVDVGGGFGADLMKNAYDFMNSVTDNERRMLEVAFMDLLALWPVKYEDFTVSTLEYVSNNETVDAALLPDLTANERRKLAGFEPDENTKADTQILAQALGVGGTQALTAIIIDPALQAEQKVQLLIKLFAFTEADARLIITPTPQP
jgi:hypothetical protein